jgi:hypothetical protein
MNKFTTSLIAGAALLTAGTASAHNADITFQTHQGGKSYEACQAGGSGMVGGSTYIVASDNAGNFASTQTWDYSTVGFVTVNNTKGGIATVTATVGIGDQTVCGAGPNLCYLIASARFTVPGHSIVSIPWNRFLTNVPSNHFMAFYLTLQPDKTGLNCATQSYETTEHDGDN